MDLDRLHTYCLAKPATTDGYPFGPGALVYKVEGKMFALIADDADPLEISLKCEPGLAEVVRQSRPQAMVGPQVDGSHPSLAEEGLELVPVVEEAWRLGSHRHPFHCASYPLFRMP
jgi:hypothetical protein